MKQHGTITAVFVLCIIIGIVIYQHVTTSHENKQDVAQPTNVARRTQPPLESRSSHVTQTVFREAIPTTPVIIQPPSPAQGENFPITFHKTTSSRNSQPTLPSPSYGISEATRQVLDMNNGLDFRARMRAVHQLQDHLTQEEINALYTFLKEPWTQNAPYDSIEWNALKNDMVNALLDQKQVPSNLGKELTDMYYNVQMDEVWRNYCVQHFAMFYEKRWIPGETISNDADKQVILSAYHSALKESDNSIAGTALIGIHFLSASYPEFDKNDLRNTALSLAEDNTCHEATRLSAISICGMMNETNLLPLLRTISAQYDSVAIRMAAIAAIGDMGTKDDTALLKHITQEQDERIRLSAESALHRLGHRF